METSQYANIEPQFQDPHACSSRASGLLFGSLQQASYIILSFAARLQSLTAGPQKPDMSVTRTAGFRHRLTRLPSIQTQHLARNLVASLYSVLPFISP